MQEIHASPIIIRAKIDAPYRYIRDFAVYDALINQTAVRFHVPIYSPVYRVTDFWFIGGDDDCFTRRAGGESRQFCEGREFRSDIEDVGIH